MALLPLEKVFTIELHVCDNDESRASGLNFSSSSLHVSAVMIVQNDENDWNASVDESEWSVLQCTTWVAFCVNIANFLDLKSTLLCDGFGIT